MRRNWYWFSAGVLPLAMVIANVPAAAAGERVAITARASAGTELTLRPGAPKSLAQSKLAVALEVSGDFKVDGGDKVIVAIEAYLKPAGAQNLVPVPAADVAGTQTLALSQTLDLPFDPQGPIAQNAAAACAASGSASASLAVPVAVRVTRGRFNFNWRQYDIVSPDASIIANPDFYADKQTDEVETAAVAEVSCATGESAVATGAISMDATAAPRTKSRAVTVASSASIGPSAGGVEKMRCAGGIVRETGADHAVCLCPGNTERVATGENAFTCTRRFARRR